MTLPPSHPASPHRVPSPPRQGSPASCPSPQRISPDLPFLHAARQFVLAPLYVPFFHCVTSRCASARPCSAENAPQVRLPSPLHSLTNKSLIEKCKWGVSALFFEVWICKRKLWIQSALTSYLHRSEMKTSSPHPSSHGRRI